MSERLADLEARIGAVRQLGELVRALRGMSAARARQAHAALEPVRTHAATLTEAIGRLLPLLAADHDDPPSATGRLVLVFAAEQGFVGTYSERLLDVLGTPTAWFLIGTHGATRAAERGLEPQWRAPMPARVAGVPRFAHQLLRAILERLARGDIGVLEATHGLWRPSTGVVIEHRRLFPLERGSFTTHLSPLPPLIDQAPQPLLDQLTADYLHAALCDITLHAFAAENQARLVAMSHTHQEIERRLEELESRQRQLRQEAITTEITELAAGRLAAEIGTDGGTE